jgi:hypothetical protein
MNFYNFSMCPLSMKFCGEYLDTLCLLEKNMKSIV